MDKDTGFFPNDEAVLDAFKATLAAGDGYVTDDWLKTALPHISGESRIIEQCQAMDRGFNGDANCGLNRVTLEKVLRAWLPDDGGWFRGETWPNTRPLNRTGWRYFTPRWILRFGLMLRSQFPVKLQFTLNEPPVVKIEKDDSVKE